MVAQRARRGLLRRGGFRTLVQRSWYALVRWTQREKLQRLSNSMPKSINRVTIDGTGRAREKSITLLQAVKFEMLVLFIPCHGKHAS